MRYYLWVLLLGSSVLAADSTSIPELPHVHSDSFYVNGIAYQYLTGAECTVVAAAHSIINRKYLGLKVRVLNLGQQSVTIKPEEVSVEDVMAGRVLGLVSGVDLAKRMRRPQNWARYGVTMAGGGSEEIRSSGNFGPQFGDTMRPLEVQPNPSAKGALIVSSNRPANPDEAPVRVHSRAATGGACDTPCQLRSREAADPDVLKRLQGQNTPEYVEDSAFLANTISPEDDASGVLYYPMPKLSRDGSASTHGKKSGLVRVRVPVGAEVFQFVFAVE